MDSLFFWISKLVWLILSPDSLLLILLIVAWILLWRGSHRKAKQLLGFVVMVLIAIALFPVGEWVFYPLENRFPTNPKLPDRVDGIIVLGGSENAVRTALWNQVEVGDCAERDLAFLMLARQYPDARLVFTSGSGSMVDQEHNGAEVMKRLCEEQGLDLARITFEERSRNTCENAAYSKVLVQPEPGERWILVTSAWHMPRSVGVFRKAGWPILPYPVDHWTSPGHLLRIDLDLAGHLRDLTYGVREWLGLTAYFVTGKTTALFPI
jgi:uncharacterized SAM-binding protein YcdF (DUF218 family)